MRDVGHHQRSAEPIPLGGGLEEERTVSSPDGFRDSTSAKEHLQAEDDSMEKRRRWYHPISILLLLLDNWFLIGIGVFIVLAWRWPKVAKEGGYIRSEYSISYGGIALIFLITGLTLPTRLLLAQLSNLKLHITTQVFSLLWFPTLLFGIVNIIKASGGSGIDQGVMVGLMVMAVLPTTVASNISMTRIAKGNVEAATAEVCVGQILGIFLSPLLLLMFFSSPAWAFARPVAEGGKAGIGGLPEIYKQVGKRMGLALFLPMVVGQIVQNIFPKPVKWASETLRLAKVSSFILLLIIWSVFSNAFATNAFESVSSGSIILIVLLNLTLYLFLTAMCLLIARPPIPRRSGKSRLDPFYSAIRRMRMDKPTTTAVCFCAAAKGLVVGAPMLEILYGGLGARERAVISLPIVLYQGEQVAVAQLLTYLFRIWNEKPDPYCPAEAQTEGPESSDHALRQRSRASELSRHISLV